MVTKVRLINGIYQLVMMVFVRGTMVGQIASGLIIMYIDRPLVYEVLIKET